MEEPSCITEIYDTKISDQEPDLKDTFITFQERTHTKSNKLESISMILSIRYTIQLPYQHHGPTDDDDSTNERHMPHNPDSRGTIAP